MPVRCQGAAVLKSMISEGPSEATSEQRPEQSERACCLHIWGTLFQAGASSAKTLRQEYAHRVGGTVRRPEWLEWSERGEW